MGTPIIQIHIQRHPMDCAVACLAMLCGISYENALLGFRHNVLIAGATVRQVLAAAVRLGHPLRWSRRIQGLEEDTGILGVKSEQWRSEHLVVLKDGMIIDTDGTLWDADVYMAVHEARATSILRLQKEEA